MLDEISAQDWTARLQSLWSQHIPLAHAMGVEVRRLDDAGLQIGAPLAPNRNHIGSAFGGSLQGLATLAGWGVTLVAAGPHYSPGVVIRESRMRFLAPVLGDLLATAAWPDPDTLQEFRPPGGRRTRPAGGGRRCQRGRGRRGGAFLR